MLYIKWWIIDSLHNPDLQVVGHGSESCSVESDSLWPPRTLDPHTVHGILQARILDWAAFPFFRGSFQPRDLNPGLPHCSRILYQLSHKGSPRILEWAAYPFSRGSSRPTNRTWISCIAGGLFTNWAIREALKVNVKYDLESPLYEMFIFYITSLYKR